MQKKYLILFGIILLRLTFILFSAGQLYYGDEVTFIEAASEIASGQVTGHYDYSGGKSEENMSSMLRHPPVYVYLLALFIFLFGENPYSIRAVSSLFTVGSVILVYFITKRILENRNTEKAETWALVAAFIYAISPIAIQNNILVDIDGGLLTFSVLLFLYFYISKKNLAYLIPSLFLVFASKLMAPTILFASLLLVNICAKDYQEILKVIKLFIIAGASFFLVFFIYVKIFNLDWSFLFSTSSILGVLKLWIPPTPLLVARCLWGFKIFFYFATPPLIFLFIVISYKVLRNSLASKLSYVKENKDIVLLWIFAILIIAVVFMAGLSGWNFAKHYIASIPPIIILIVYFTPKRIKNIRQISFLIFFTTLILSLYFIFFLKDPLVPESQGRFLTVSFSEVAKPVLIRFFMYAIVPIFLCIGLFKRIPLKKIWLTLFFLLIFTSLYIDIMQSRADYSTHYLYGDKGLKEVIDYMKDKPPNQILCYMHVGYYLGFREIYELTSIYYDEPKLKEIINKKEIKWIILYQKDIISIGNDTLKDFELEKEIGSYKILKRIN